MFLFFILNPQDCFSVTKLTSQVLNIRGILTADCDVTEQIVGQQSHQQSLTSWPRYHQSLLRVRDLVSTEHRRENICEEMHQKYYHVQSLLFIQLHLPIMWESWTLKGFHRISPVQFSCMRNVNKPWRQLNWKLELISDPCSKLEFHARLCRCSLLPLCCRMLHDFAAVGGKEKLFLVRIQCS